MTARLTRFFGRDAELPQVLDLLRRRRLVTLTGSGGAGKTRLAQEACDRRGAAAGELRFVDLGAVEDGRALNQRVANAVGIVPGPEADPVAAMIARLGRDPLLLVLDTCEHLVEPVGALVARLLEGCPGLVVLATSREPIGMAGEAVFGVPSLDEKAAAELFIDRATLVQPSFDSEAAREDVATICERVDWIPLAIELAASWAGTLTPVEIIAGLDDALGLLAGSARGLSPRHRTLRASLAWSYELLSKVEQRFFRRLGVFVGSFTSEAAAAVVSDAAGPDHASTLVMVRRLVAASLVSTDVGDDGTRYRLLDTVRQFALDRLDPSGELDQTRDRHLDYHLELAEHGEHGLDEQMDEWRRRLAHHHDDITAALRWALDGPGEESDRRDRGRRLAAAMARYWMLTGNTRESLEFLAVASAAPAGTTDPPDAAAGVLLRSRLACGTAMVAMVAGRLDMVTEAAEQALADATVSGEAGLQARCRMLVGYPFFYTDFARCYDLVAAAAEAAAEAGDAFTRDLSRALAGYCQQTRGHHEEAVAEGRAAVAGALPRGDRFSAAFGLGVELFVTMVSGQVEEAIELGRKMVELATPLGDYFALGTNTVNAALPVAVAGDLTAAHELMDPVVAALSSAPPADVVGFMVPFGYAALWGGDLDTALRWFRRGVAPAPDGVLDWTAGRCLPGLVKTLRLLGHEDAIGEATRAVEAERAFNTPYELANALDELGHLHRAGDPSRARELYHDALDLRIRHGIRLGFPDSLDALAFLDAETGNHAHALRLFAAATRAREAMHYPRPIVDRAGHEEVVGRLQQELGDRAFTVAWREGLAWDLDGAIAVINRGRGPRRRPETGWDSLTPTESKIVELVVTGLSNPEIAQRVFMSRSTVKTHLSHVYAKLGVTGRAQLVAAAADRRDHASS